MSTADLARELHRIGAVSFGDFELKSGIHSPFYVDLRRIISYPEMLKQIASGLYELASYEQVGVICGVPYTAMPIATAISLAHRVPMVMRRKEAKHYGTTKLVEGIFTAGQRCVVVEDVITSGASVIETCRVLEAAGLEIDHLAVVLDREQGGKECLERQGYQVKTLLGIRHLVDVLADFGQIGAEQGNAIAAFIKDHRFDGVAHA